MHFFTMIHNPVANFAQQSLIGKFKIMLKCASLQFLNICDHRTTTTKIKIFFLILQKVFVCFTKTYRIITYAMPVELRMGTLGKLQKVTVSIVVNIHPEILKLYCFQSQLKTGRLKRSQFSIQLFI